MNDAIAPITQRAGAASRSVAQRVARMMFPIDEKRVRRLVDERRDEGREAVAEHVVSRMASRSAMFGALTGLPGGALGLLLLGVDARGAWGATATIAAARHYHDDPSFFERDDWWLQTVRTALGARDYTAASLGRDALGRVALERGVRWGARRAVSRVLPLAGSVVGSAWNYAWVRREGRRIFA